MTLAQILLLLITPLSALSVLLFALWDEHRYAREHAEEQG